jgi:hypothetical protein
MKVALAVLCIGAVTFLLRVLAALIKEWANVVRNERRTYSARPNPTRQRGLLIEMNSASGKQRSPRRTGERIAL